MVFNIYKQIEVYKVWIKTQMMILWQFIGTQTSSELYKEEELYLGTFGVVFLIQVYTFLISSMYNLTVFLDWT